jgi:hypothetical protein
MDRVVEDVLEGGAVLLFGLDLSRPEAAAEDVVSPSVTLVERAGVLAVEIAHSLGQVRERRFDEQVVVVAEEAAGMQAPAVPAPDAVQDPDEDRPVGVVQEDRRLVVPFRADVVVRAGGDVAVRASHAATVAARCARNRVRAWLGTPASHTRHVPGT